MVEVIAAQIAEVLGVVFLHMAAENIVTDRKSFRTALSHSLVFRSRRLRVSMAQVLSLKVDDKYLLVTSVRRPERVTPIGGVIRYFPSEVARLEGAIGFQNELDNNERYDLRGYIHGKDFVHFLRWFASGSGREQHALGREIIEEFKEIGIAGITRHMSNPEFIKDRIVHEGPSRVRNRDYWQYRYFEVCSLREEAESTRRLAGFIRSQAKKNPNLVLVSTAEIKRGRLHDGRIIGDSCGYLFSDQALGVPAPPLI